jgi:hypothetical protein
MRSERASVYGKEIDSQAIVREVALERGFQRTVVVEKLRKQVDIVGGIPVAQIEDERRKTPRKSTSVIFSSLTGEPSASIPGGRSVRKYPGSREGRHEIHGTFIVGCLYQRRLRQRPNGASP